MMSSTVRTLATYLVAALVFVAAFFLGKFALAVVSGTVTIYVQVIVLVAVLGGCGLLGFRGRRFLRRR